MKLSELNLAQLASGTGRLSHLSIRLGSFPLAAVRERWLNSGLRPPKAIPSDFLKLFFLLESLVDSGDLNGRSVIDFGCGLGVFVAQASRLGMTSVGIDTFGEYGGECRRLASIMIDTVCESVRKPLLIEGDIARVAAPGRGSFDFATSIGVMEHVVGREERSAMIEQMMQSLAPGGWLILICGPNRRFPVDFFHYGPRYPFLHQLPVPLRRWYLALFAKGRNQNPRWLSGMSVRELEAAMRSAGATSVQQLFPLWARLAVHPVLRRFALAYVLAARLLTFVKAEPVIILAARKRGVGSA